MTWRLDSQFVVRIHMLLLTWIGKRLATYEKNKNAKSRKVAVMFFRVLLPIVLVESEDALKMYVLPIFTNTTFQLTVS